MAIENDQVSSAAANPFAVGVLGAIVALRGTPGTSWWERAFNLFCGAILAGYLSPALAEYFDLKTPATQSAAAFVVGLFGLNMVATVVQWSKTITLADLLPWRKPPKG